MPEVNPYVHSAWDGWYAIGGLDTDACVEGTGHELRALARAIRQRTDCVAARRCAVSYDEADGDFRLWSPRNSQRDARLSVNEADALADEINRYVVLTEWANAGEAEQADVLIELGHYAETLGQDIDREEVETDDGHDTTIKAVHAAHDLLEWARKERV